MTDLHPSRLAYSNGCRCQGCRDAAARYERGRQWDALQGRPRRVGVLGTRRRLQALAALGWDWTILARHIGCHEEAVRTIVFRRRYVYAATAERVAEVYEELSMTPRPATTSGERNARARAVGKARRYGWAPPLAWDDIDDPTERPKFGESPRKAVA